MNNASRRIFTFGRGLFPFYYRDLFKHRSKSMGMFTKVVKPISRRGLLLGIASGMTIGVGYSLYKVNVQKNATMAILNPGMGNTNRILSSFPNVEISRRVLFPTDSSGLKITLFQYPTCPFCCKVRAFLDYNKLSYDVVEVNPVLRQQLKWSKEYKKVPIVLIKIDEGYMQLNDSTMIISALSSYLYEKEMSLQQVVSYYPSINYTESDGTLKSEILNRYFLMYRGSIPDSATKESISNERKWRVWADSVLVHTLSPNVYRSTSEALESFEWFSEVGEWKKHFSKFETTLVIYVGALAMWIIGKRLKKKHQLKDDVRVSLYDDTNFWLKELNKKNMKFHGGSKPDLADLAVFGVLSSIEGCSAFNDLLKNTKVSTWYSSVKELIKSDCSTLTVT